MSEAERKLELLGALLDDERFREWLWLHLAELTPFHGLPPSDALHMAWHEGRRAVGLALIGDVTNKYPLRYASMVSSASAWRSAREAREEIRG